MLRAVSGIGPDLYGVGAEERAALEELAGRGRKAEQPWWRAYIDMVPERYAEFLGFEAEAHSELEYQTVIIPGLLQTERYARAVTEVGFESAGADQVDALVEVRMRRQQILTQESPANSTNRCPRMAWFPGFSRLVASATDGDLARRAGSRGGGHAGKRRIVAGALEAVASHAQFPDVT